MAAVRKSIYQTTNHITGQKKWWALGSVMITMFFSAMDQTVVSTAMPTIIGDLKGFSLYAWVFTAYMMASSVTVPLYGKLSDTYGRKPFYIFGLLMFMLGSVFSGQARTITELIISRALQGIGAGAMMSMPRATIGDIFNPRERGKWMGALSGIYGLASIFGPYLGGWITDNFGWRWIFYINLPFGILALIAVIYALPSVRTEHRSVLDWKGSILLVTGLLPVLLAFTWAGNKYAWNSFRIISLMVFGTVFIILFLLNEKREEEPILSPELFKNRIFTVSLIIGFLISIGLFGGLIFLPLFIQGVIGLSAKNSGAVLTPMMLSFITGSIIGGVLISKTGRYKLQAIVASAVMIYGTYLLSVMDVYTTWPIVVRNMVILGLGVGSIMPLINVIVQNAFPYKIMGVVNSTQQFVRSLGGVIVAPIYGTVLANIFKIKMAENMPAKLNQMLSFIPADKRAQFLNPQNLTNLQAQEAMKSRFMAFGSGGAELFKHFLKAVKESLTSGFNHIYTVSIFFAAAAFIAAFFLKEINLKHDEYFAGEQQGKMTGDSDKNNTLG
ncbi:MAG: MFS transporter [Spirochaetes bacterium]|nr:MFS transporter [Spirochaetota bacterium]